MCGINGVFGIENKERSHDIVRRMNITLQHRGPDADGIFADDHIAMGHQRLAIIDLSKDGQQPFYSADKRYVLVFNGEIYNFRELKKSIPDFAFKTNSDTEVVLAAYLKWGKNCVEQFNGMFAFAIWDSQEQKLVIARDRLGIKPLYYAFQNNHFLFSSEIRAVLASGLVPAKMNKNALVDYVCYQTIHAPATIIEDVLMLPPGSILELQDAELKISSYWNAATQYKQDLDDKSYAEICEDIKILFSDAVQRRMIADVPFGAFLSGGIDSSAVVAMMAMNSSTAVSTFNIAFEEEAFSEAKYARIIAKKYKTNHHEIKLRPDDLLHVLPNALAAMDHPSGDGPNSWLVSRVTKEAGITMALSGLGGDELFAGYDVFKRMHHLKSREWLQYFPMPLRKLGAGIYGLLKPGVTADKLHDFLRLPYFDYEHVYPLSRQVAKDKLVRQLLNQNKLPERSVQKIMREGIGSGTSGFNLPELSKISYGEMYSYMQNVLLRDTDQMSMAHALEVRVPFLDYTLVEYVMGVKSSFKFPTTPKKLLCDSLGDLLPQEIIHRPKMGFTFPWDEWMRNELRDFCSSRIKNLAQRDCFNEELLMRLWNDFLNKKLAVNWARIWYLVVLEDYLSNNSIQ